MHNDLKMSHKSFQDELRKKVDKNFKETEAEKFERLCNEFDIIRDNEHSEWYILYLRQLTNINNLFDAGSEVEQSIQPQKWFDYAQFCLRYGMNEKAEILMHKYISIKGLDTNLNLLMGAMNLQN